jgi:hypothetical protein
MLRPRRADTPQVGNPLRKGLHSPPYIYDSQTISKFTDSRELLIGGAQARLPAAVVIAQKQLADAEEFGTEIEVTQQRRKLAGRMQAALKETEAELTTLTSTTTDGKNATAVLTRRRELLQSSLADVLKVLLA